MRRKSLKRMVALVTAVSILTTGFASFATEADTNQKDTSINTETTGSDSTDAGNYINERIENNYTNISAKYTFPKYTGESIPIEVDKAWDEKSDGTLTNEVQGYTNAGKVLQMDQLNQTALFNVNVEQDGTYLLRFDYLPYDMESILSVEGSIKINGDAPFFEAKRVVFESDWLLSEETPIDRYGNETVALPDKSDQWLTKYLMDASYRYGTPLAVELKKGDNTISFTLIEGKVKLGNLYLEAEKNISNYQSGNKADGDELITIMAQNMDIRNDSSIRPTNEYDMNLAPYETSKKVLNIIDSSSFSAAGQKVTYKFNVKKAGYYYIGSNYRQNDKKEFPVFMDIRVDGEIPNKDMNSYPFKYNSGFEVDTLKAKDENMAIYLEAGDHTLSFTISNDNIREALEVVDRVMSEINDLSLEITKVAGTNKDKYRELKLTDYIPDVEDRMAGWIKELEDIYSDLSKYSDASNAGALSSIKIAIKLLKDLAENPNDIPYRKAELAASSSSVNQYIANFITDISANKIAFDRIYVYQEKAELPAKAGFFARIWEWIKRFFSSFTEQSYSVDNVDKKHLQVWVNRSRQYLEIIQQMIDRDFTPKTGIEVDLCIMPDANKLILANSAGEAPDVAMAVNYALPYDLAIRNAIVDLTQYPDYKEVLTQFPAGMLVPSTIDDGIYSVPETFYFWVLYYRTDILEKLGLEVPQTMEDVKNMLPDLKNRGLDFFYPTAGTVGQRTFAMTTPLVYQHGGQLYNESGGDTTINNEQAIKGLTELTELFTIYNLPKDIGNFYQHFRNGDIPIGISDYFVYNMLNNAAPEIENSWDIALVPGVEDENGDIQRQTAGGAESGIIFRQEEDATVTLVSGETMNREDASWEYLKWWMSTDVQVEFGSMLQTTYGKEFIWNSANKEAFAQLPWKSDAKKVILEQMEWITESPRIPGTYMLEREMSNAYVSVVTGEENLRTAVDNAVKRIDRETQRKMEEFGYIDGSGNVLKEYKVPNVDTVKEILGTD